MYISVINVYVCMYVSIHPSVLPVDEGNNQQVLLHVLFAFP